MKSILIEKSSFEKSEYINHYYYRSIEKMLFNNFNYNIILKLLFVGLFV